MHKVYENVGHHGLLAKKTLSLRTHYNSHIQHSFNDITQLELPVLKSIFHLHNT